MSLTTQERALMLLSQLDQNKPHGKSTKEFYRTKDVLPPLPKGAGVKAGRKSKKGGADLTVNYGNNPQYPLERQDPELPYIGNIQNAASGVVALDPSGVGLYKQTFIKAAKARSKAQGKTGFIGNPSPVDPLAITEISNPGGVPSYLKNDKVKRKEIRTFIPVAEPVIYRASGEKKERKKKNFKQDDRDLMKKRVSDWHQFYSQIKERPCIAKLKSHKPSGGSMVRELMLDSDSSGLDTSKIMKILDERVKKFDHYITLDELEGIMDDLRKELAGYTADSKFPLTSVKRAQYKKKVANRKKKKARDSSIGQSPIETQSESRTLLTKSTAAGEVY